MNQTSISSLEKKIRDDSFRLRFIKALTTVDETSSSTSFLQRLLKGEDAGIRSISTSSANLFVDILIENILQNRPSIICLTDPQQKSLIKKNLAELGLEGLILDIDSNTSQREIIASVQNARLQTSRHKPTPSADSKSLAVEAEEALNAYAKKLCERASDTNLSVYEFIAKALKESDINDSKLISDLHIPYNWSTVEVDAAISFAKKVEMALASGGIVQDLSSLYGLEEAELSQKLNNISVSAKKVAISLAELEQKNVDLNNSLGLKLIEDEAAIEAKFNALTVINELYSNNGEYLKKVNLDSTDWLKKPEAIVESLRKSVDLADAIGKLPFQINLPTLKEINLDRLELLIKDYNSKNRLQRFFANNDYNTILTATRALSTTGNIELDVLLKSFESIKKIQSLYAEVNKNSGIIQDLFNPLIKEWQASPYNLRAWRKILLLAEAVVEVKSFANRSGDENVLTKQMLTPDSLYRNEDLLRQCKDALLQVRKLKSCCLTMLEVDQNTHYDSLLSLELREQMRHFNKLSELKVENIQASTDLLELERESKVKGFGFIFRAIIGNTDPTLKISASIKDSWLKEQIHHLLDFENSSSILKQGVDSVRHVLIDIMQSGRVNRSQHAKQSYLNSLPNLECGGRAALLSRLYEGSSELDSNTNLLSLLSTVIARVKPIIFVEPDRIGEIDSKLLAHYPSVVVSSSFHKAAADDLSKLNLNIKQLISVTDSIVVAPRHFEEDLFADLVKSELEARGLTASRNVKLGENIAEIVVWSHNDSNLPLAVIATDGPNYQEQKDFYQREFAVENKFKNIGVPVFRVWISEWAEEKVDSLDRLISDLQSVIAVGESSGTSSSNVIYKNNAFEFSDSLGLLSSAYTKVNLDKKVISKLYRTGNLRNNLQEWISIVTEIVITEGPIHKDLLKLRLKEACGLIRNTDYFEDIYRATTTDAVLNKQIVCDGDFFRIRKSDLQVRDRSSLKWDYSLAAIPRDEIELAILTIIDKSCGISHDELQTEIEAALGIKFAQQVGLDKCIDQSLQLLLKNKIITEDSTGVLLLERKSTVN
jgi:hypothetical protein